MKGKDSMNKMISRLMLGLGMCAMATTAFAEAAKLQEGVNAIKEEAKAASETDGKVTKEERKALRKKLKASSEAIRNAKKPEGAQPAEGGAAPAAPAAPAEGGSAE